MLITPEFRTEPVCVLSEFGDLVLPVVFCILDGKLLGRDESVPNSVRADGQSREIAGFSQRSKSVLSAKWAAVPHEGIA